MSENRKRKITVLHLIDSLPREGAEMVVHDLIQRGDRKTFDFIVCALTQGGGVAHMLAAIGVPVVILKRRSAADPRAFYRLLRTVRANRVDIIHTHIFSSHVWGAAAAVLTRKILFRTEHSMSEWKNLPRRLLDRLLCRAADQIIAVSEPVRPSLIQVSRARPEKVTVIKNGLNLKRLRVFSDRAAKLQQLNIPPEGKIVATAAALTPTKGHRLLLQAAAAILKKRKNVYFLLMGEGELREELANTISGLGLGENIRLLGSRADALEIISVCDVFALSSTREGLSIALLEAMALGRAVVATAVGGTSDLIENGVSGLLVPPDDAEALAKAVESVLDNPEMETGLGKTAAEIVRAGYAIEPMVEAYQSAYLSAYSRKRGAPEAVMADRATTTSGTSAGSSPAPSIPGTVSGSGKTTRDSMSAPPNRKTTVLHLIDSLPREGAEMVVHDLIQRGDRKTFDFIVCTLTRGGGVAHMLAAIGVPVVILKRRSAADPRAFYRLLRTVRANRVDIIHTHLFSSHAWGTAAAVLTRKILFRTEHNMSEWKNFPRRLLDRLLCRAAARIIAVSEPVRQSLIEVSRARPEKVSVIENSLNLERLRVFSDRAAKLQQLNIPPEGKIVATAAALTPKKGHRLLLRAVAAILKKRKNVYFLLMGEGELREELANTISGLGLGENIRLLGSRADALEIISVCDVFALSSTREGLSIALLEAMALGRAVVATAVGGTSDLIENGVSGLLVPPDDAEALAKAVESVLDSPEMEGALGKAAAERVRAGYAIEPMVEAYQSAYLSAYSRKR